MPNDIAISISNDSHLAPEETLPSLKNPTTPQAPEADGHPNCIEDVDFLLRVANGDTNGVGHVTEEPSSTVRKYSTTTQLIHADDHLNGADDVAPPLHVSTTFRYPEDPDHLIPAKDIETSDQADRHVYSRHTAPTTTRLEALLTPFLRAPSLTYSSGLSALHAAYVLLRPRHVAITGGYHGAHAVLNIHSRLTGLSILPLDCDASALQPGDVVHLETPINPTGEALSIKRYAEKAHSRGAYLLVDSTFAPPPLQDPFMWGADVVMHSGTKYFGGHSDMLCGVLATRNEEWTKGLADDRAVLGSVMGGLEGWLGVRSLRTVGVRVERQSRSAEKLVGWLQGFLNAEGKDGRGGGEGDKGDGEAVRAVLGRVQHASLQVEDMGWLKEQMPGGYGPVFAIWLKSERLARRLPSKLELFHHATSLGGVESLIEWRTMSDTTIDTRLLRVSVGLEDWEDLREDLRRGFRALWMEERAVEGEGEGGGERKLVVR
ncbi:hypothetical protein MMC30_001863 [Trapelia coarctata]|nr:hypothetical protein [Trapelia coarctata]